MRRASEMPHVERIVHVGLRGVGSARASDVEDSRGAGNLLVTARELRDRGGPWLLEQIPPDASVFVSFDFDGLDPLLFPAVSALAPGGLSFDVGHALLSGVASRTVGLAFTEFVPGLDAAGIAATVATRFVMAAGAGVGEHRYDGAEVEKSLTLRKRQG
jgi:agmatinase